MWGLPKKLPPNSERRGISAIRSQWSRKSVTDQILLESYVIQEIHNYIHRRGGGTYRRDFLEGANPEFPER